MTLLADIKYQIVTPVVEALNLPGDTVARIQLSTGIGNRESGYRTRVQGNGGPARGYWQVEPATHDDLWKSYLPAHPELQAVLLQYLPARFDGQPIGAYDALVESDEYCAGIATLLIRRSPYSLPARDDAAAQCRGWKQIYNTQFGAGVVNAASIALFEAAIAA